MTLSDSHRVFLMLVDEAKSVCAKYHNAQTKNKDESLMLKSEDLQAIEIFVKYYENMAAKISPRHVIVKL